MNDARSHVLQIRVYYEDTDAGGIVYHAQYIKFAERGRTEFLRTRGINQIDLRQDHGFSLVVHTLHVTFLKPAKLDDFLEVHTILEEITEARFHMSQYIYLGDQLLTKMHASIALIDVNGRPKKIPEFLKNILGDFYGGMGVT